MTYVCRCFHGANKRKQSSRWCDLDWREVHVATVACLCFVSRSDRDIQTTRSRLRLKKMAAAAAWPGNAFVRASSQCALLLPRSPLSASFALAPPPGSSMRRRFLLGVGTPAVAALAAAVPPAVLQDGAATVFVTAGAYALVRAFDVLTERRLIQQVWSFTSLLPFLSNKQIFGMHVFCDLLCLEGNLMRMWMWCHLDF